MNKIIIRNAAEHNLKNISVEIPHNCLTVITGVSGSGKSSLAFDTLFKESQRRYLESFSSYARQFLGKLTRPSVEHIDGLSPTIAVDQKSTAGNPRSTVGTITGLYDYLRLLFARLGAPPAARDALFEKSPWHGLPINEGMFSTAQALSTHQTISIDSPRRGALDPPQKLLVEDKLEVAIRWVSFVVSEGISGIPGAPISAPKDGPLGPSEGAPAGGLERRLFSFNSPYGACPACKGLGVQDRIDYRLLIADPKKTLREGALLITTPSGYIIYSQVTMEVLDQVCRAHGFSVDIPWAELGEEFRHIVLYGSDKIKIPFGKHPLESRLRWSGITPKPREEGYYKGIIPIMEAILKAKRNENILRFARTLPCAACNGTRLRPEALAVTFRGENIAHMAHKSIDALHEFFTTLKASDSEAPVLESIREAFLQRTVLLKKLGLGYLTLDRESTTLSTGEGRRLRLASQVGSGLRGVIYVLDEPSAGLHYRDNQRLLEVLFQLRDSGNTVIVVEHDEDIIRSADWLIDIGPGAGVHGGEILFSGPTADIMDPNAPASFPLLNKSKTPPAARGLFSRKAHGMGSRLAKGVFHGSNGSNASNVPNRHPAPRGPGPPQKLLFKPGNFLKVIGATEHNLKNIDVPFRIGALNVVTGVSGAGKSSLVHDVLANALRNRVDSPTNHKYIEGREFFDKLIEIDQSPIGRSPRSNPATYTKLFDLIRDLFASLPESKIRKWDKGRFSFNVKGGRCEACEGAGFQQIGLHFLGSFDVPCPDCSGKRFNDDTLVIRFLDKNISDILDLPIETAAEFFQDFPKIHRILQTLLDLGLGYITLGQSATTLSGGEAQRVKLASELCRPDSGNTLYILDEPTTGLHNADIQILLVSLLRLTAKGNTVISVENHPYFINSADWVITLGPESGDHGGELVAVGPFSPPVARGLFSRKPPPGPLKKLLVEDKITLKGICTHNLKHIDVSIPVNRLVVITGVSGSGKSSLAFDTIFAEGQKRFLDSFSTYARRLLANSTGEAEFDSCNGMMPTIAVRQEGTAPNPRSTVGTMTDIYDYYRLIFSRFGTPLCPLCNSPLVKGLCSNCGFKGHETLTGSMFSFNHHEGACSRCKGLGITRSCDPAKLISHPGRSLSNGAMDGSKTGKFYGDPFGQHMAILQAVGEVEGIDFSKSWEELDDSARHIAMFGTGDKQYAVAWKFKRKNREGVHHFNAVWKGLVNYVDEEYQRKHADKRGSAMLHLMSDRICPQCRGQRLKPEFLSVYLGGKNIAQLCQTSIEDSINILSQGLFSRKPPPGPPQKLLLEGSSEPQFSGTPLFREWSPTTGPLGPSEGARAAGPLAAGGEEILKRLRYLCDLGLGYLTLDRSADTLSAGEAQRVRLAAQLGSGLTGIIYVLDEPTAGLHSRDTGRLVSLLKKLRDRGNTVIVVEHDRQVIREADYVIDLGPGAGREGGYIVAEGSVQDIENHPNSRTGFYLRNPEALAVSREPRSRPTDGSYSHPSVFKEKKQKQDILPMGERFSNNLFEGLKITGAFAHNLKEIDIDIPSGGMVVLTGVSGSGKSSLLFDVVAASAKSKRPAGCRAISGFDRFGAVIPVDQAPVGSTPASTPATFTGIFDHIRDLFAGTDMARSKGLKKSHFSFNVKGGRCEACQGMGRVRVSMDFLADVWTICDECKGKRFSEDTLACTFQEKTIADVLAMTVREAVEFFVDRPNIRKALDMMAEVGLDYLQLGQGTNTLSGGEAQRLKLVDQLIKGKDKNNLYLLDEPTTGLHFEDIGRLLGLFRRLVEEGHTLVVIEHHPDVIRNGDYIIELGPGGGDSGGRIISKHFAFGDQEPLL